MGKQGKQWLTFWRRSALGFLWKEWCQSWNSSTLATSCEELTHWKRLWCWEGLGAGGEGDGRGWDGWMASLTRWTWVWVNSGSWWWTGRLSMLQSLWLQRVRHDWATQLNWTDNVDHIRGREINSQLFHDRHLDPDILYHNYLERFHVLISNCSPESKEGFAARCK